MRRYRQRVLINKRLSIDDEDVGSSSILRLIRRSVALARMFPNLGLIVRFCLRLCFASYVNPSESSPNAQALALSPSILVSRTIWRIICISVTSRISTSSRFSSLSLITPTPFHLSPPSPRFLRYNMRFKQGKRNICSRVCSGVCWAPSQLVMRRFSSVVF